MLRPGETTLRYEQRTWRLTDVGIMLQAQGVSFRLDERMAGSVRVLRLGADSVDYELSLATQRVADRELHLRAPLAREP